MCQLPPHVTACLIAAAFLRLCQLPLHVTPCLIAAECSLARMFSAFGWFARFLAGVSFAWSVGSGLFCFWFWSSCRLFVFSVCGLLSLLLVVFLVWFVCRFAWLVLFASVGLVAWFCYASHCRLITSFFRTARSCSGSASSFTDCYSVE